MKELELKYGCNRTRNHQRFSMKNGKDLPDSGIAVTDPRIYQFPGCICGWQLVSELKKLQDFQFATSF